MVCFTRKGGIFGGGQEGRYEYQKLVVLIKRSFLRVLQAIIIRYGRGSGEGGGRGGDESTQYPR